VLKGTLAITDSTPMDDSQAPILEMKHQQSIAMRHQASSKDSKNT
jgi:hypothetical protein